MSLIIFQCPKSKMKNKFMKIEKKFKKIKSNIIMNQLKEQK